MSIRTSDSQPRTGIRILPEILSNKIAAGEVVERPASVVKELVENSLDAGSSTILIEIENGGRRLIRVSDNGSGMNRDDALLSVERYATSKILSDEDLFNIRSLGFRGEALPSIASVSRFTMETRELHADTGTCVTIEGGKIIRVTDAGIPAGTLIAVRDIFFNTPARRKFLKSTATEIGHIADNIAGITLAWPQVRFDLLHQQKTMKQWLPTAQTEYRVADTLNLGNSDDLIQIHQTKDQYQLSGWIAAPHITRKTTHSLYLFVNRRHVKDQVMRHALIEGFSGRLMKGHFPLAALYLNAPYHQVDVNVHPAKAQVRFVNPGIVHELIRSAVSASLQQLSKPAIHPLSTAPPAPDRFITPEDSSQINEQSQIFTPMTTGGLTEKSPESPESAYQIPLFNYTAAENIRLIGQLHDTYMVCESQTGLILIDQHAAHERILYEMLKHRASAAAIQSQMLITPEMIEFGFRESVLLEKLGPELSKIGLDIEHFGGNTYIIKAVPVIFNGGPAGQIIKEIVEELAELGLDDRVGIEPYLDRFFMLTACHAAVRANQRLANDQMLNILKQLAQCQNPCHCPHGRPITLDWSLSFLEKSFRR